MADTKDYLAIYRRFFEEFATTVNPDDQLPVKVAGYYLCDSELVGEIVDWTLQYLNQKQCPSSLVAPITRIVVDEIKHACRKQPAACGYRATDNTYQPLKLMQVVTGKVNEVCLRYRDNGNLATLPPPSPGPPISSCAIKNTRRRMEDRHVIIEDFHAVFNIQDWSPTSYYAVFDGHAGTDAAVYSVSHLHQFLAESSFYPTDPERALRDAFSRTDALFLEKSNRENLRSGTTAVCALLRPKEKMLYVAWLGDSQAVLVRNGQAVQVVNPHKPDRQDERERIEVMGGCVLYWGTWRVNGQLAVSRAIGDPEYKPYVTAEPDVTAVPLNGTEDFLVLACDGLWDFVTEQEAIEAVYQQLCEAPGDLEAVSQRLVQLSKQQGSTDNISVIVVFLRDPAQLAMDSDAGLLYKHNGTAAPSATDLYFLDRQDDDDDLGPETDVDAVDDVLLSPAIAASKAAALRNNNPFSLEADLELQRQQLRDFDPESEPRHDTPTPPADQVAGEPGVAALVPESDNVAESGEDSEDEWNYYRVEPSAGESQQSTQQVCEKSVQLQLEDESNMESQLNPDAAEFVPSPTQLMPSMEEVLLAQSPRKGVPMEDISVPSQIEFQHEVSQRPSELEATDKLPDLISSGLDTTNPFVHNGGSYSDFLEDVEQAQKSHVLDESEASSTKAEFGDDSTMSFLTTGSELQKTVTESVSSLSAMEKSLVEQDLLGAEFTSGVSKSNNGSTCDENELSEFNESEMLVSENVVEENVLLKDSSVINTEGTIPMCFELQKELVPEMELQPERVQLESEGTSSFEQDESGSPVGKKSEEPALSFEERSVTPASAVNQLFSEDVSLGGGLGTATSTPETAPLEQEPLLSPKEDKEIKLYPDAPGILSPDLNEAFLLQQWPEPTAASKASLLDFSLSHKVNPEPFIYEKLADNIEVMGAKKEVLTFDLLAGEGTIEEQEMSVTQTPPPTPAHVSDEEPIRIPPLPSPSLSTCKPLPLSTQISISEQIHPQTETSLSQQISPFTQAPLPEQASSPILTSVSEEAPLPTLASASEEASLATLAPASEEALTPTLAHTSEEAPLHTLASASEEAPSSTLAPASEETPLPTVAPASEEAPLPTLASASEEASLSTLEPASEETLSPTLAPAYEEALLATMAPASGEAASPTLAPASEETLSPTLAPASEEALLPTLAPVTEQIASLAHVTEQIPSLALLSERIPSATFTSLSEPIPSPTTISEPVATCTSAPEGLKEVLGDSAVLAATSQSSVAIVPAVKAVSAEKKTSTKKQAPAKDKKVPVAAEKAKAASQKATSVTKTVQKSTPTSPTKPASSTIRSSTPKKPSSTASKPTKSPLTTSKPGMSPSKPPASKTAASPRPRPAATTTTGTAKSGSLSNGDVAKSSAAKKPAATATRPQTRPATAPAGTKQVTSTLASRTTAVSATAQRPKLGTVNGTAAKTRATGTVATAAARNKVAAARDTKLATDKQVKETANKHILSARATTVTATRRVASSVTKTTVTATGTVKATAATSKVGSKKTTTSTGVARTTTTTKTTKTAASVNNESAVQVAD